MRAAVLLVETEPAAVRNGEFSPFLAQGNILWLR